jgi:CBS-domain-containing membrane protein
MHVKDLMRRQVVTLSVTSTLDIATDIMTMGRIRHLPVVDDGGMLVGIVTQRDLYRAAISSVLRLGEKAEREWLGKVPVFDVMTADVVTVGPEEGIIDALTRLLDRKVGALPVVERGRLVGLLTETDCLRSFRDMLKAGRFTHLLS